MPELFSTSLFNDANLKAYYRFEGNANDSSSLGSAGTNAGATFATGMFGQGAAFAGSAHISAGNYGSLTTYTINSWVNVSVDPVTQRCIMGAVLVESSTKKIGLFDGVGAYLSGTSNIQTNRWYMVSVTKTGTLGQVFVNGNLEATGSSTAFLSSDTTPTGASFIGGRNDVGDNSDYSMNGTIDDLAIFNRVLSNQEINSLYTQSSGLYTRYW